MANRAEAEEKGGGGGGGIIDKAWFDLFFYCQEIPFARRFCFLI